MTENHNIATGIVAHTERLDAAKVLSKMVSNSKYFVDDGTLGAGKNHMKAWEWLATQNTEWSICLEDDALPVAGFNYQVYHALANAPTPVVSLYLGRVRPGVAQERICKAVGCMSMEDIDPNWLISNDLWHHVGVAVRTEHVEGLCTWLALHNGAVDEDVSNWAKWVSIPVSYTWPSLVEHDWQVPTVIEEHISGFSDPDVVRRIDPREQRRAWKVGTREHWNPLALFI